jgi:hypothetical protein
VLRAAAPKIAQSQPAQQKLKNIENMDPTGDE